MANSMTDPFGFHKTQALAKRHVDPGPTGRTQRSPSEMNQLSHGIMACVDRILHERSNIQSDVPNEHLFGQLELFQKIPELDDSLNPNPSCDHV